MGAHKIYQPTSPPIPNLYVPSERPKKGRKKIILISVVIIIVIILIAAGIWSFYSVMRDMPDFGLDGFPNFDVDHSGNNWTITVSFSEESDQSYHDINGIYIMIQYPNGTVGLDPIRLSKMESGQYYSGVRFFNIGDSAELDDGDYFTVDSRIFDSYSSVTIMEFYEHGQWSSGFSLNTGFFSF